MDNRVRYGTAGRKRYDNSKGGMIKKAVLRQTVVCSAVLLAAFLLKDSFFTENSFIYRSAGVILTENTDFAAKWTSVRDFFKEQIKVTSLLSGAQDLDPVRNMTAPLCGEVYQGFGLKKDEASGTEEFCYGVKIKANEGDKISAAQKGEVVETGEHETWGKYILIKHSEKIYSFYAHLGEILPQNGENLKAGQVIGTAALNDKEGFGMLYFEIRDGESMLDPEAFIDFTGGESAVS